MTLGVVAGLFLATVLIGAFGVRAVRTTSDFLVASRSVSPTLNAAAIAGEYLSAASVIGVAGLVLKFGVGMLWYPVGFTAGYVALLTLVAAPLRRSGAFTIPDFAEGRLQSPALRRLSAVIVLVIGWLYLVPQLKGAGVVLRTVSGTPYWVGVALAGLVVSTTIALGGMRGSTYVQAFQYGVKLLFIGIPAVVLLLQVGPGARQQAFGGQPGSTFGRDTTVVVSTAATLDLPVPVSVRERSGVERILPAGRTPVSAGQTLRFPAGAPVPKVAGLPALGGPAWQRPLIDLAEAGHPLFGTWSVLLATVLGTMGLPHVLVRFNTNPDGRTARRAAVITVGLLAAFYLFPAVYGLLGRVFAPGLYLAGTTDTVVVALPGTVAAGGTAAVLTALVTGGAFAGFLATSSGVLLTLASGLSHDLLSGTLRGLRQAVGGAALVAVGLALPAARLDISVLVGWAFAVAASTFCPLLVLGIWWRRLSPAGAVAGLAVGAATSVTAIVISAVAPPGPGWPSILLAQPAAWSVPLAFATMVIGSLVGRGSGPAAGPALLARMHSPEPAGVASPR